MVEQPLVVVDTGEVFGEDTAVGLVAEAAVDLRVVLAGSVVEVSEAVVLAEIGRNKKRLAKPTFS